MGPIALYPTSSQRYQNEGNPEEGTTERTKSRADELPVRFLADSLGQILSINQLLQFVEHILHLRLDCL